ncbi:MAG: HAD family hydrolase [Lachnospiraceae bacterium]|nr:HAD family hydrolase [Lachnospiraceae bacterium]
MKEPRICFFDIDDTLWDFHMYLPESTREALAKLKENGHYVFLNSGRARAMIRDPKLFSLGFNGVVSGMGTMAEYVKEGLAGPEVREEDVLYYNKIPVELAARTIRTFRRYNIQPMCEGRNYLYFKESEFRDDDFSREIRKLFGSHLEDIDENENRWEISKFTTIATDGDREACFKELEADYDYVIHNDWLAEAVPKGFSKGTGIRKVAELLGIPLDRTVAFGDSVNDLPMLETAGTAVVMGNGSREAREKADYVTAPLKEDGIYKACRHLGLI